MICARATNLLGLIANLQDDLAAGVSHVRLGQGRGGINKRESTLNQLPKLRSNARKVAGSIAAYLLVGQHDRI